MRPFRAPEEVIRRLAVYLRIISRLDELDNPYVSSKELAEMAGVSPAQVRKDLATFGEFGKQGVGYDIRFLKDELKSILNANCCVNMALIGVGELGMALGRYNLRRREQEKNYPFNLLAAFDVDPSKVGKLIDQKLRIFSMEELDEIISRLGIVLAMITVPAGAAQEVVDRCTAAGVKGILNFAPVTLKVPPGVRLHHADMTLELQQLAYYL